MLEKNSGTTVKNSTVKNRKSSVSYTITYFLLCFARQAWLLWRFGVRQPPESGIQDPGSSCWMADGCTKFGREGAGTFQCPRPFYVGRNLTFPSRGTFQCRGSGPGRPHDTNPRPAPVSPLPTGPFLPFFGASDPKIFANSGLRPEFGFWASEITGFSGSPAEAAFYTP